MVQQQSILQTLIDPDVSTQCDGSGLPAVEQVAVATVASCISSQKAMLPLKHLGKMS